MIPIRPADRTSQRSRGPTDRPPEILRKRQFLFNHMGTNNLIGRLLSIRCSCLFGIGCVTCGGCMRFSRELTAMLAVATIMASPVSAAVATQVDGNPSAAAEALARLNDSISVKAQPVGGAIAAAKVEDVQAPAETSYGVLLLLASGIGLVGVLFRRRPSRRSAAGLQII